MTVQFDMFGAAPPALPAGFRYAPDLLSPGEQAALAAPMAELPFAAFEFHGFLGKRRTVSFGWKYDFSAERVRQGEPIPAFLLPLRDRVAAFAQLAPSRLEQVLVTEYGPGAAIGWHRDKAVFDEVVGVSLGAPCTFRFRRSRRGGGWERKSLTLAPGSAYIITGEARAEWEHSIPPVEALRYSVTFRSLNRT